MLAMGDYTQQRELYQIKTISNVHYISRINFPALLFFIFLARFISVKIDGTVVSLSFAVNMARFGNINLDEFTQLFSLMYRMRCYVRNILIIIVFSLANSFRIVSPNNTIGKQFTQHNITLVLRFSSYFFSYLFLVSRLVNRLQCH